jgi:hypothetical protein
VFRLRKKRRRHASFSVGARQNRLTPAHTANFQGGGFDLTAFHVEALRAAGGIAIASCSMNPSSTRTPTLTHDQFRDPPIESLPSVAVAAVV